MKHYMTQIKKKHFENAVKHFNLFVTIKQMSGQPVWRTAFKT
jgi:hypothetical protein